MPSLAWDWRMEKHKLISRQNLAQSQPRALTHGDKQFI